jgi:hypothetical protein
MKAIICLIHQQFPRSSAGTPVNTRSKQAEIMDDLSLEKK